MVMVVVVVTNSKGCQQTLNEKLLLLAYNGWHIFKSMNEEEGNEGNKKKRTKKASTEEDQPSPRSNEKVRGRFDVCVCVCV